MYACWKLAPCLETRGWGVNPPPEGYTKEKFLKGREPARATEVARVLAREQELHNLQNKL
jgi:hypothetical protein